MGAEWGASRAEQASGATHLDADGARGEKVVEVERASSRGGHHCAPQRARGRLAVQGRGEEAGGQPADAGHGAVREVVHCCVQDAPGDGGGLSVCV